jgi:acetate kinase
MDSGAVSAPVHGFARAPTADGLAVDVLALNSGSSSLKFGLFRAFADRIETLITGEIDAIGKPVSRLSASRTEDRLQISEAEPMETLEAAVARIEHLLFEWEAPAPAAIGHRIVHGGPELRRHCQIDGAVLETLEAATVFAPLHTPAALQVIRSVQARYPGLPQIACLDTAFHADMPDVARVLPIPRALRSEGVQRFGFHGLSCESIVQQLSGQLPERMISAHLGGGASITAVRNGRSVDTSMGLTPTGGVMMSTRSGDLDPGVLLYLMRAKHLDAATLEDLVDRRSGLLGVSGLSSDMRELEAAPENPDAHLAIRMFEYAVRKEIAAMASAMQGAELIVFTGGIGENDWDIRSAICTPLAWMGVDLDPARNRAAANPITLPASRCEVRVLPSEEDQQIARHTRALVWSALNPEGR